MLLCESAFSHVSCLNCVDLSDLTVTQSSSKVAINAITLPACLQYISCSLWDSDSCGHVCAHVHMHARFRDELLNAKGMRTRKKTPHMAQKEAVESQIVPLQIS